MYFYQRIKDLREDSDLYQKEVANLIDCQQQQYQLYECGKREIPFHSIIQLADFYNVSLDYIAGRTNDKKGLNKSNLPIEDLELLEKFHLLSDIEKGRILGSIDTLLQLSENTAKIKDVI